LLPQTKDLAEATGTHAPSLNRVLRLLASAGVFAEQEDGCMVLTPLGQCLRAGVPGSARAMVMLFALYDAAGFTLLRIVPTQAEVSVIEGLRT
jgi:hypothetical protein